MFAQATRQAMEYGLLDCPPVAFKATADAFFKAGGRGLNVTVPHKQAALPLCDSLTPRARRAGAVNTLARGDDGKLLGDNTDGAGLVRDLVSTCDASSTARACCCSARAAPRAASLRRWSRPGSPS